MNYTNILRATFLNKSVLKSFSVLTVCVCNLLGKENWEKAARNMFVKLTIGRGKNKAIVETKISLSCACVCGLWVL